MKKLENTARDRHRLAQKRNESKVLLALVLLFIANLLATPSAHAINLAEQAFPTVESAAVQSLIPWLANAL